MEIILVTLLVKHFLADYVFNPAIEPTNKHIYGSKGSLAHLGMHMVFCFIALVPFLSLSVVFACMLFDGVIHYHEDFVKTKYLHKRKGLSDRYRRAVTGADQLVHMLTYVAIYAWVS